MKKFALLQMIACCAFAFEEIADPPSTPLEVHEYIDPAPSEVHEYVDPASFSLPENENEIPDLSASTPFSSVEEEAPSEVCDTGSRTLRFDLRHSQGAGIGYTRGYSTLEVFFSTPHCYQEWTPFLDLRGHVFNNGKFAANTGFGLRYLSDSIAWGMNSYYDYRDTRHFHYNQWGLGLEAIGSFWSLNINGYLPVGKKRSQFFDLSLAGTPSGPTFAFFQGHELFITLSGSQELVAKQEFALKGIDAKFLIQAVEKNLFSLEIGAGPYYFQGPSKIFAAGGEASVTLRVGDYLTLSAVGSYDNLFHQRGQGVIGLSIPFGPKNFSGKCSKPQPCQIPSFFNRRLAKGAHRDEIVVLDSRRKVLATATPGGTEVAINPATGLPYSFWFVNNQSHSDGTFESPYPTVQEALTAAQPDDVIYVYPGDGSPYDVAAVLQDGQYFFGSGIVQQLPTTKGLVSIPAQSNTSPTLENSTGPTIIATANQNTISGFALSVLNAGDIVSASGINSLSFKNNQFATTVATGMNNLALTDCTGDFFIENNGFTVDPADTGSIAIQLSDSVSGSSLLSVVNNTFTNHAGPPINLSYSSSSSPTLDIRANDFTPPSASSGLNAINIATAGAASLAGSISNSNNFSDYTGNTINLNWASSGIQSLAIANNTLSSDPSISGTNGIFLTASGSGTCFLLASNNQLSNQTSVGINCNASAATELNLLISGNTLLAASGPGNSGVQVNGSNSSSLNVSIQNNGLFNHTDHGINLFVSDTATIAANVDSNTLTVPDSFIGTGGIQVSAGNSSAATSSYSVTNNVCTGHTNANIQCFPNQSSILNVNIAGNILTGPATTPIGSFPNGIQISTSNSAIVTASIHGMNRCLQHAAQGINLFSSDDSQIIAAIDGNFVSSPISTSNTSGITVGGNNSSSTPLNSYTITNNTCVGQNGGAIQCFPSQNTQCSLIVSNNAITAAVDGISSSGPAGIQVGANQNSEIVSMTISGNSWTSPRTYQSGGTPQGISVGANDSASIADAAISGNTFNMIFTSYPANTGPTGIQSYLNNNSTCSDLAISHNVVNYSTSNYANDTGPSGIQVNAQNNSALSNVAVSNNTVSFAPLHTTLANFQQNGISINGSDASFVGTGLSPALLEGNTVTQVEGNGITIVCASSNDIYINALNNSLTLGAVMKNEIGIVTVPFGSGRLITEITGNTIDGQNGGFIGIAATNQSPVCQSATISNNTVSHVHSNNPAIPIPGLGGGIGAAILGAGNLNVFITDNGVSYNTPQGIFGIDSDALGGSGALCIKLQDNHGANHKPPDNYVLYNPTGASPLTFVYQDAGGNLGTLSFSPSSADFTPGTCSSCP